MDTGNRADRYTLVAWREIQTEHPREPQLRQALEHANGDPEAATQFYVSTRVVENTEIEMEREAAERRLHKLWQFHDSQAWRGEVKVFLFAFPLVLMFFCMLYRLFCK